jgi:Methyltransferase domain
MSLRRVLAALLAPLGYVVWRKKKGATYAHDGLMTIHDAEFLTDPVFMAAYARGLQAAQDKHIDFQWRVHTALWVGRAAKHLPGDFVECGVNQGFISSAVMHDLGWNELDKDFWLLDTYRGPVEELCSEAEWEREKTRWGKASNLDLAISNFGQWPRTKIIEGPVPDTLSQVTTRQVAYLHIDMNSAKPEVAAADHFWPLMVPGGLILLDDYCYDGYREQKVAMDNWAREHGTCVLSLPTGQGMLVKPPDA